MIIFLTFAVKIIIHFLGVELYCRDLSELSSVASKIITFIEAQDSYICLFDGQMGAGKTTLIKAICAELGVMDNVSSPTFSIVNEYLIANNQSIYHFDFYRLKSEREALEIGIEEYFEAGNLCFLEWASQIPSLIPSNHIKVIMSVLPDNQRLIKLSKHE